MDHFELYQDEQGAFRWRFRASTGEMIADSSEGYRTKEDCERALALLRLTAATAPVQDSDGRLDHVTAHRPTTGARPGCRRTDPGASTRGGAACRRSHPLAPGHAASGGFSAPRGVGRATMLDGSVLLTVNTPHPSQAWTNRAAVVPLTEWQTPLERFLRPAQQTEPRPTRQPVTRGGRWAATTHQGDGNDISSAASQYFDQSSRPIRCTPSPPSQRISPPGPPASAGPSRPSMASGSPNPRWAASA